MKARLSTIKGGSALRTPVVEGELAFIPKVGQFIRIAAAPIVEGTDVRLVTTSEIKRIEDNIYCTENSIYKLELLDD